MQGFQVDQGQLASAASKRLDAAENINLTALETIEQVAALLQGWSAANILREYADRSRREIRDLQHHGIEHANNMDTAARNYGITDNQAADGLRVAGGDLR